MQATHVGSTHAQANHVVGGLDSVGLEFVQGHQGVAANGIDGHARALAANASLATPEALHTVSTGRLGIATENPSAAGSAVATLDAQSRHSVDHGPFDSLTLKQVRPVRREQ